MLRAKKMKKRKCYPKDAKHFYTRRGNRSRSRLTFSDDSLGKSQEPLCSSFKLHLSLAVLYSTVFFFCGKTASGATALIEVAILILLLNKEHQSEQIWKMKEGTSQPFVSCLLSSDDFSQFEFMPRCCSRASCPGLLVDWADSKCESGHYISATSQRLGILSVLRPTKGSSRAGTNLSV